MVSHCLSTRPPSPIQREGGVGVGISGVGGRYSAPPSTAKLTGLGSSSARYADEAGLDLQQRSSTAAKLPNSGAPPPVRSIARHSRSDCSAERSVAGYKKVDGSLDRGVARHKQGDGPVDCTCSRYKCADQSLERGFSPQRRCPDRSLERAFSPQRQSRGLASAGPPRQNLAPIRGDVTASSSGAATGPAVVPLVAAAAASAAAAAPIIAAAAAASPASTPTVASSVGIAWPAVSRPLQETIVSSLGTSSTLEMGGDMRRDVDQLQAQMRTWMTDCVQLKDQQEKHKTQTEAALVEVCKSLTMQQQQLEQQEQCTGMIHQLLQESLPGAAIGLKRLKQDQQSKQDQEQHELKDLDAQLKRTDRQEDKQQPALISPQQPQLWRPITAALKASIEHVAARQEQLQECTLRAEQSIAQLQSSVTSLREQMEEQQQSVLHRSASSHRGDAAGGPRLEVVSASPALDSSDLLPEIQEIAHPLAPCPSLCDDSNNIVSRSSSVGSLGPLRGELAAQCAALCQERFLGLEQKLKQEMESLRVEALGSTIVSLRNDLTKFCEQQFETLRGDTEAMHLEVRQQCQDVQARCVHALKGELRQSEQALDPRSVEEMRREQRTNMSEMRCELEKLCEHKLRGLADMGWALQREFEAMLAGASKLETLQAQRQARQMELTEAASSLRQIFSAQTCVPSQTDWQHLQEKHAEVCHIVAIQQSVHACQASELDALRRAACARFIDVAKILRQSSTEPKQVGVGLWHEFHEKQMVLLQSIFEEMQRMEFGQASELESLREEQQVGLSKLAATLRQEIEAMSTRVSHDMEPAVLDFVKAKSPGLLELTETLRQEVAISSNDLQAMKDTHAKLSSAVEVNAADVGQLRDTLSAAQARGLPAVVAQDLHIKQTELSYVVQVQQKMLAEHAEELEKLRCEQRSGADAATAGMRQKIEALSEVVRSSQQKLSAVSSASEPMPAQIVVLEPAANSVTRNLEAANAAKVLQEELGAVSDVATSLRKEFGTFCGANEAQPQDSGCLANLQKKLSEMRSSVETANDAGLQLDAAKLKCGHASREIINDELQRLLEDPDFSVITDGGQSDRVPPCVTLGIEGASGDHGPSSLASQSPAAVSSVHPKAELPLSDTSWHFPQGLALEHKKPERTSPGGWRELREELNAAVQALPSKSADPSGQPELTAGAAAKCDEEIGPQIGHSSAGQALATQLHQEAAGLRVRLEAALQNLQEVTTDSPEAELPLANDQATAADQMRQKLAVRKNVVEGVLRS